MDERHGRIGGAHSRPRAPEGLTAEIARWATREKPEILPPEGVAATQRSIADLVGVAAGATTLGTYGAEAIRDLATGWGGTPKRTTGCLEGLYEVDEVNEAFDRAFDARRRSREVET